MTDTNYQLPAWQSLINKNYREIETNLPSWLSQYWPVFSFDERLEAGVLKGKFSNLPQEIQSRLKSSLIIELNGARANRDYALASELISFSVQYYSVDFSPIIMSNLSTDYPSIYTPVFNAVTRSKEHCFLWYLMDAMDETFEYEQAVDRSALNQLRRKTTLLRGLRPSIEKDEALFCRWVIKAFAYELRIPLGVRSLDTRARSAITWANEQMGKVDLSKRNLYQMVNYMTAEFDFVNVNIFNRLLNFVLTRNPDAADFDIAELEKNRLDKKAITDIAGYFPDHEGCDIFYQAVDALEANGFVALLLLGASNLLGVSQERQTPRKILINCGLYIEGVSQGEGVLIGNHHLVANAA